MRRCGRGAGSSALSVLCEDQTRKKACVLNNYLVIRKVFTLLKYFGGKGCKVSLVPGTKVQFISKCNGGEKCSLRPFQSYWYQII